MAQSYLQLLSTGLQEQIITPGEVMHLVDEIEADLDSERTGSGEGFENAEFSTETAPRVRPDIVGSPH